MVPRSHVCDCLYTGPHQQCGPHLKAQGDDFARVAVFRPELIYSGATEMPSQVILFLPVAPAKGYEHFFRTHESPEKYGIELKRLTPRFDAHGYGFSVCHKRKRYRGYASTQGYLIVRLANQKP